MKYLANILSCTSLFFGFLSIVFSLEQHFTFAAWAILISVVFDGLDGQAARISGGESEFGKELDSLIDVISFGIAPAVLGYIFVYREFHYLATIGLFFYLLCSVMRLAKYNITAKKEVGNYFIGLPTTMSGGALASFILIFRRSRYEIAAHPIPEIFLILILIFSLLMISKVKYLNLDGFRDMLGKRSFIFILALGLLLGLGLWFNKAGTILFIVFLFYLIFSPFVVKKINAPR